MAKQKLHDDAGRSTRTLALPRIEVIDYAAVPTSGPLVFLVGIPDEAGLVQAQHGGAVPGRSTSLYVYRRDHDAGARPIRALAGPDLVGLRAGQLAGCELRADGGASVGLW